MLESVLVRSQDMSFLNMLSWDAENTKLSTSRHLSGSWYFYPNWMMKHLNQVYVAWPILLSIMMNIVFYTVWKYPEEKEKLLQLIEKVDQTLGTLPNVKQIVTRARAAIHQNMWVSLETMRRCCRQSISILKLRQWISCFFLCQSSFTFKFAMDRSYWTWFHGDVEWTNCSYLVSLFVYVNGLLKVFFLWIIFFLIGCLHDILIVKSPCSL